MKNTMIKSIIILTLITFIYNNGSSQDIIKLGEKTAKKVQRKVDSGINRSIDKTLNDAEKEIKNSGKKTPDKKTSSSSKTTSSSSTGTSPSGVQEKYDFKPFDKINYSFKANDIKSQDETSKYFNQTVELVQLENQKGNWIKLEPNIAYCPLNQKLFSNNWAIEINMIPQLNFEAANEINLGIALVDSVDFDNFTTNISLEAGILDSLKDFHLIQLNKPKGKEEINIVVKSKKATNKLPVNKKIKYTPVDAAVNKNTFAISNSGTISKIYYCNKKITSFQNSSKNPKKMILFVLDDSNESSLYIQSLSVTVK